jgi:exopolyphosphatase/guanosine-5'-triphosphate,3'-diphosphate pyrophosphatase
MQTIAVIDIGSNAMRLLIGGVGLDGKIQKVESMRLPVRLGQDVFSNGSHISEETAQLSVDAFTRFRKMADDHQVEKIRAVATSAMREAKNSDLLCDRIARATGIEIEIISGEEEARLIHLAVANAADLKDKYALSIDIGGGSVEVTLSLGGNILSTESYNMGTVRLLQKLGSQPDLPFEQLVREYAQAAKRRIERDIGDKNLDLCLGTGGNIEEMGELRKKIFKRESEFLVTVDELDELIQLLGGMNVEERMKKFKLKPDRADVILPAMIVLNIIAREAKIKEVRIPNVGLKDGILIDLAQSLMQTPRPSPREQVWTSALRLGEKYQFDSLHGNLVARLAGSLFDQTYPLHGLDEENKLLLEVASLLHDIGHFIGTLEHDKHAYYILQHAPLIGLSPREQGIVANVARYHRKSMPAVQDENFRALSPKDRAIVIKLSTLMRLADAMDVSHTYRVQSVSIKPHREKWKIQMQGEGALTLESWALEKRRATFQDVFGAKLEIE